MKYILVTGGVLSGVGKGVIASSLGRLLKELEFNVTSIKIDPYINIDAGTMSPFEHGEVYVLDDGGEVDLDLGNYERFLDSTLSRDHNITTGKIYNHVIQKERKGEYLGKTVQVVPHITNEIQDWIERVAQTTTSGDANKPDICVIELGGTVGDIESMPFVEAMRQFQFRVGKGNFCEIHVSLVPVIGVVGEQKTKPTQHTVKELRSLGLNPDLIICRSEHPLTQSTKQKISSFCHVDSDEVVGVHNVPNVYIVPLLLAQQGVHKIVMSKLQLHTKVDGFGLQKWKNYAERYENVMNKTDVKDAIHIAVVGKYTVLCDAYISIDKALKDAAVYIGRKVIIDWIESTDLELDVNDPKYKQSWSLLQGAHGVLIPGGFGDRGIEGKIKAAKYARESNIPFLGICLGFQLSVIEFTRNILKIADATSEEFTTVQYSSSTTGTTFSDSDGSDQLKKGTHVIVFMPEISKTHMGGTMRLGKRKTVFNDTECSIAKLYGQKKVIEERHRHRYEVNPEMVKSIEEKGMKFVGQDEEGKRMQILQLESHAYFVGTQFHPEYLSRPFRPSPPFLGLLKSSEELYHSRNQITTTTTTIPQENKLSI